MNSVLIKSHIRATAIADRDYLLLFKANKYLCVSLHYYYLLLEKATRILNMLKCKEHALWRQLSCMKVKDWYFLRTGENNLASEVQFSDSTLRKNLSCWIYRLFPFLLTVTKGNPFCRIQVFISFLTSSVPFVICKTQRHSLSTGRSWIFFSCLSNPLCSSPHKSHLKTSANVRSRVKVPVQNHSVLACQFCQQ